MKRSDERGIAIIAAVLMMLLVSVLTTAMMVTARTETVSSLSYTNMSQVRYGAESGIHAAANYLLSTAYTDLMPGSAGDALTNYDVTVSPVTYNGNPVVLSSNTDQSNYPVDTVKTDFSTNSQDFLSVNNGSIGYSAQARLLSMRQFVDNVSGIPITLQTWEITGTGSVGGAGSSTVEVTAVIERQTVPVYSYAAFATDPGCAALSFSGGATTDSYDSGALSGGNPVISLSGGNVGTNGNLDANGNPTTIYGTLSTPRAGVGNCTSNNVTAATIKGWGAVEDGLVTLPQQVKMPNPPAINPMPPTSSVSFSGCPAGVSYCSLTSGDATITPPTSSTVVSLGDMTVSSNKTLRLHAGVYHVNSLKLNGNANIQVESGPVIIKIAGKASDGTDLATPLDLSGGGIINNDYNPSKLQFIYGGTGTVKMVGGANSSAVLYAPNASGELAGNSDFYGSIIVKKVKATGGVGIHYDRRLQKTSMTSGNPSMTSFTWKSF